MMKCLFYCLTVGLNKLYSEEILRFLTRRTAPKPQQQPRRRQQHEKPAEEEKVVKTESVEQYPNQTESN